MRMGEASAAEGRLRVWLTADKVWACWKCRTHLASQQDKKPRRYLGYFGSAYLFRKVVNVRIMHGDPLVVSSESGFETVVKARCIGCGEEVGQKFLTVPDDVKFKKNRVLLERRRIVKEWHPS